jgi:hypothetical protein
VGYGAAASGNIGNATAIGYNANAPTRNYVAVGNTSVKTIAGQVAFSTYSDGRFKFNIKPNVKGLVFINKLHPVTYQVNTKAIDGYINAGRNKTIIVPHTQTQTVTDSTGTHTTTTTTYDTIPGYSPSSNADFTSSTAIVHSGFIAQSVDSAANAVGFTSSIVHRPENSTDPYALSYAEIVVPLVKAVQELSKANDSLKSVQKTTDSLLTVLQKQFITTTTSLQQQITNCCTKGSNQKTTGQNGNDADSSKAETTLQVNLVNNNQIILYQNEPNPFGSSTIIRYFVPENITETVYVVFYDMYGEEVNTLEVKDKGFGKIEANTENLASGIYSYSLIVNNKTIDTKKMMRSK